MPSLGESDSYDVLVGIRRGFWRVQVKRAPYLRQGQYVANAKGNSRLYTKDDIDFIAAHLIQENIWYIVPIEAFEGRTMLHFIPNSETNPNTKIPRSLVPPRLRTQSPRLEGYSCSLPM